MYVFKKIMKKINSFFRRCKNNRVRYMYADQNAGWTKWGQPVIGNKSEGTCFDPCVRIINEKYVMFYSNRKYNCIVRSESDNGIVWNNKLPILEPIKGTWEEMVNRCSFVVHHNKWYLWYTGQYKGCSSIGFAISNDGITFNRSTKPVLTPEYEFEGKSVMNPCVLFNPNLDLFEMFYSAGETYEPDVICYASSKDGINWRKKDNPILWKGCDPYDQYKVGGCDVHINSDGKYEMYYIGYQNLDVSRICKAISSDCNNWSRDPHNPLLSPSCNKWDSDAVYKPTYCYNSETHEALLWYNGRKKTEEYIGLARKIRGE